MKRLSFAVTFWLPFGFSAFLCYMTMMDRDAAGPAFYSFLPIAFMFVALAFGRLYAEVRRLENKLHALEARSRKATSLRSDGAA